MADPVSKSQLEMASQLENFAITLFQVVGKSSPGNMCISPFSVATLLSMVHAGSKGETAKQLKESLGLGKFSEQEIHDTIGNMIKSTKGDESIVLKSANLCYVEEKFKLNKKFQSIMEKTFGAQAKGVNFGDPKTRKKINSHVEELTNKKIEDLLSKDAIGQATVMVLVNAIYFKGDWMQKFVSKLTKKLPFFLGSDKSKVDVKMMSLTHTFRTGKIEWLDAQFVQLPYKGEKVSMTIILPNKIDGLTKVESGLSGMVLEEMEKNAAEKKLCVELPEFKIETMLEEKLKGALSMMGVKDLFKSGLADLSGVSDSPGLFASNIVQKCYIKVDEKGSEAAAATGATGMTWSAPPPPRPPPSFKVDHPAVFLLKDDAKKVVLFIGRLANPAQK